LTEEVGLLGKWHSLKQLPIASNSQFWTQLSDITFENPDLWFLVNSYGSGEKSLDMIKGQK